MHKHNVDLIAIALQTAQDTNNIMLGHYAGLAQQGDTEALKRITDAVRYDFSALDTSDFADNSRPRSL